jgi:hypothetical protein
MTRRRISRAPGPVLPTGWTTATPTEPSCPCLVLAQHQART